ncbi:MAG: hypothetical protein IT184_12200 [Acidobacteria bacterium]|nr:hypothetical protein [Acidobacteriota bacterium]
MSRSRPGRLGWWVVLLIVAGTAAPAWAQQPDPNRKYGIGSEARQGMLFLLFLADVQPYSGVGFETVYNHPLAKLARGASRSPMVDFRTLRQTAEDNATLVSVVGQFGYSRVNGANITTIMGGPRVTRPVSPKASVFGQATAGLVSSYGSSDFGLQPGGGVIVDTGKWIVSAQLELLVTFFEGGSDTSTRISAGVAIPFGQR